MEAKRRSWVFVGLWVAAALVLSGCLGGGTGGKQYAISGRVVDERGNGISGVLIAFTGGTSGSVQTGPTGEWQAKVTGKVSVQAIRKGYEF